ncbi:DNA-3-methyladenine glycosylase I, partial [Streptomyces thermogriseus]
LAKALRKRGFRFVGPTTMFALMEAVGIVDTHVPGAYKPDCS